MPKVYVPQVKTGRFNIDSAKKFGEIVTMFDYRAQVTSDADAQTSLAKIRGKLEDSTEQDSIIMIGDPVIVSQLCNAFVERHGLLNVLKWDKFANEYRLFQTDYDVQQLV